MTHPRCVDANLFVLSDDVAVFNIVEYNRWIDIQHDDSVQLSMISV